MEDIVKGLVQLGVAGLMSAVNVWVLWYLLTKTIPDREKQQSAERVETAKSRDEATKELVKAFRETLASIETRSDKVLAMVVDRSIRDEERSERRHKEIVVVLERVAVKQEEMGYDLDLIKSEVQAAPDHEPKTRTRKGGA